MSDQIIILDPLDDLSNKDNKDQITSDHSNEKDSLECKNAPTIVKQQIAVQPKGRKYFIRSFVHSLRWSQFKRRLEKEYLKRSLHKHWFKTSVAVLLAVIMYRHSETIQIGFNDNYSNSSQTQVASYSNFTSTRTSVKSENATDPSTAKMQEKPEEVKLKPDELANVHINNVDLSSIESSKPREIKGVQATTINEARKTKYINRFIKVATDEMNKYKVPASVYLGIAILSSDYGTTKLAQEGNNHFGISCSDNWLRSEIRDEKIIDGDCLVYYQTAWASFRSTSKYISNHPSYKSLTNNVRTDYKYWADSLEKIGYKAPNFSARKLKAIIEKHELQKLDK
ncbi:MAG: glucosaminidase domain-containing protein [Saprospiraceae bacterium]|nr:glucosaminidase domain-containing protein [Saprospiraceae bacterium]